MFFVQLLNYLRGFVTIQVDGFFTERFLNICIRRGIYLWNVCKTGKHQLEANVSIRAFHLLRPIARKSRCRVRIRRRKGAPFVVYKYRKRKFFAVGIGLFALLLFVMTRFVWVIEISGNQAVSTQQILQTLHDCGVETGMRKRTLNQDYVKNQMLTLCPELSWLGIQLRGTTVTVEVKERLSTPDLFPADQPCDIVADREGVIESLEITNGVKLVAKNDVVHPGQKLVSGTIESELADTRYVHSDGVIMARTWREKSVTLPQYEEIRTQTGKNKSKHGLKLFNFYVKLYISDKVNFAQFDRVSEVKNLSLWNRNVLPVSFHYDKYYEVDVTRRELTLEEATLRLQQQMDQELAHADIVNRQVQVDGDLLTVTYECIEPIGEKTDIDILYGEETNDDGEIPGS